MEAVYCTVMYCVYGYSGVFLLNGGCLLYCDVLCVWLQRSIPFEWKLGLCLLCCAALRARSQRNVPFRMEEQCYCTVLYCVAWLQRGIPFEWRLFTVL